MVLLPHSSPISHPQCTQWTKGPARDPVYSELTFKSTPGAVLLAPNDPSKSRLVQPTLPLGDINSLIFRGVNSSLIAEGIVSLVNFVLFTHDLAMDHPIVQRSTLLVAHLSKYLSPYFPDKNSNLGI